MDERLISLITFIMHEALLQIRKWAINIDNSKKNKSKWLAMYFLIYIYREREHLIYIEHFLNAQIH